MTKGYVFIAILCVAVLAACSKQDSNTDSDKNNFSQPSEQVTLSADDVEQLGIRTKIIADSTYTPSARGFGSVLSFDNLAQSVSNLATAEAALRQSRQALQHDQSLAADKLITREGFGMAQRQVATDEAQVALAERKQAVDFGRDAPWRSSGAGDQIIDELAKGRLVLVRVSFQSEAPFQQFPNELTIERVALPGATTSSWKTTTLWPAPANPNLPGQALFALVANSNLAEGERVVAMAPSGSPETGTVIPGPAIVFSGGNAWFYSQIKPGVYKRHPINIGRPVNGGYFAASGAEAGQAVVVQGASLLLAHELNPGTGDKD